jgi:hypothetical protein
MNHISGLLGAKNETIKTVLMAGGSTRQASPLAIAGTNTTSMSSSEWDVDLQH